MYKWYRKTVTLLGWDVGFTLTWSKATPPPYTDESLLRAVAKSVRKLKRGVIVCKLRGHDWHGDWNYYGDRPGYLCHRCFVHSRTKR